METQLPSSLQEAILYFSDPDRALEFVTNLRWPGGPECPRCGAKEVTFLKTRRLWKCRKCQKQFSVKAGTIFEDSPLGLDKWLCAIWLVANCKNGISSYEIARNLKITQKSAWFMEHRIRLAMQTGTFTKLSGQVEADETFVGGKARNMHPGPRARKITGTGGTGKTAVMGLLERHGEIRARVVPNTRKGTLQGEVRRQVEAGSELFTDACASYQGLTSEYDHQVIDHAEAYVEGQVHTNGLENFWSLLKRGLRGTYVSVEPKHLFRYLDEQVYRFNNRKASDAERFAGIVKNVCGRRLTWEEVTGTVQ